MLPLVSMPTDRQTDTRLLHYAFRYERCQRNKSQRSSILTCNLTVIDVSHNVMFVNLSAVFKKLYYFASGRGAPRAVMRCVSVCLSVCLSVRSHISKTTRPNFTKFTVRVNCGPNKNAKCYVLPVLKMESCFHIMAPVKQNQTWRYASSSSPGGGTGANSNVYDCLV